MQLDLGTAMTSFHTAITSLKPDAGATTVPVEKLILSASEATKGIDALADDAANGDMWSKRNAVAAIESATQGVQALDSIIGWYNGANDLPHNDQSIAAAVQEASQRFEHAATALTWE